MYPTVIIVLVETQRLMKDICDISLNASNIAGPVGSETRAATLGHLSFDVGPIHNAIDNELESQRSPTLRSQDGQEHDGEKEILEMKESQVGTSV